MYNGLYLNFFTDLNKVNEFHNTLIVTFYVLDESSSYVLIQWNTAASVVRFPEKYIDSFSKNCLKRLEWWLKHPNYTHKIELAYLKLEDFQYMYKGSSPRITIWSSLSLPPDEEPSCPPSPTFLGKRKRDLSDEKKRNDTVNYTGFFVDFPMDIDECALLDQKLSYDNPVIKGIRVYNSNLDDS